MIQQARSINSTSLLREAELAVLVLENENQIDYFQEAIDEVVKNRKDEEVRYTGAKDLKRQLLALLNQYGEVKTANVWCRELIVDLAHINHLRKLIADALAREKIYGVVEIHLQDREINSPHIQFVGIEAERAEDIIAEIVVDLKYELSMESAKGSRKGFMPHYDIDSSARTSDLSYWLEREQRKRLIQEIESEDASAFVEQMREQRKEFLKMLDDKVDEIRQNIQEFELPNVYTSKRIYEKTTEEAIDDINERIREFRRR